MNVVSMIDAATDRTWRCGMPACVFCRGSFPQAKVISNTVKNPEAKL